MRKTRTVMALAGFCVGVAVNAATETKFGLSIVPGAYGTPDTTDLFYGAAASTFAAATGPSVREVDLSHFTNVNFVAPERLEELQVQGAKSRTTESLCIDSLRNRDGCGNIGVTPSNSY